MKNSNFCKFFFFFIVTLLIINKGESQVLISTENGSPDASAMLEIYSKSKGLLIPRMSTEEIGSITDPAEGLLVYDLTLNSFFLRGNTDWINLSSSAKIWLQNTTDVYLNDLNKNVGIGTINPIKKLHIVKNGFAEVMVESTGSSDAQFSMKSNKNVNAEWEIGTGSASTTYDDDFYIYKSLGTNGIKLVISDDGNVGVGSTNPLYKLDVNGSIVSRTANAFRLRNNAYSAFLRNDGINFYLLFTDQNNPDGSWNSLRPFNVNIATGNTSLAGNVLNIIHGGNVGIGTAAPNAKLEVRSSNAPQIITNDDPFIADIHGYHENGLLVHTGYNEGRDIARFSSIGSGYVEVPRMVIKDNGNVGIGTTTPAYKLDVAGDINYTGEMYKNGSLYPRTYQVGDFAQGGIVFWVDETGQHGLVCAKSDQDGGSGIRWYAGTYGNTQAKGDGPYAGELNTSIIIAAQVAIGDDGSTYAARVCNELQITEGGKTYGDWYLPSKQELNLIYQNKSIIDATATANDGIAFASAYYWSSTEYNNFGVWLQSLVNGFQSIDGKISTNYVRAVRAF